MLLIKRRIKRQPKPLPRPQSPEGGKGGEPKSGGKGGQTKSVDKGEETKSGVKGKQ
jgi:hypothetical protein